MPRSWTADTTHWPVALISLEGPDDGQGPDEASFTDACESLLARRERHAVLLDLTGSRPSAERRRRLVEWGTSRSDRMKRYTVALALVAPSSPLRGIITAFKWLVSAPFPYEVFATRPEASRWLDAKLRLEGLVP